MPTSEFQLTGWHSGPNGGGTFGLRFGKFSALVVGRPKTITLHLTGSEPFPAKRHRRVLEKMSGGETSENPRIDEKARYWISMARWLTAPLRNKNDFGEYVSRLKKHGLKMKPAMQWIKSSATNSQSSPTDRALR